MENDLLKLGPDDMKGIVLMEDDLSCDYPENDDVMPSSLPGSAKLKCRFCKLLFDSKSVLVNHLNVYCKKLRLTKLSSDMYYDPLDKVVKDMEVAVPATPRDTLASDSANIPAAGNNFAQSPPLSKAMTVIHQEIFEDDQPGTETIYYIQEVPARDENSTPLAGSTPEANPDSSNGQQLKGADDSCNDDGIISIQPSKESGLKRKSKSKATMQKLSCLNGDCSETFDSYADLTLHHKRCLLGPNSFNIMDFMRFDVQGVTYCDSNVLTTENAIVNPTARLTKKGKNSKPIYQCTHCEVHGTQDKICPHLAIVHAKRKPFHCSKCDARYVFISISSIVKRVNWSTDLCHCWSYRLSS